MKLNEAVYGSEHGKFWYASSRTEGQKLEAYINAGNKFFCSTYSLETYEGVQYSNGQLNGYANKNRNLYSKLLEESICYAAIPANSPLAHISYLNRTSSLAGRYEAFAGDVPLFLSIACYAFRNNANSSMGVDANGNSFLCSRWGEWSPDQIAQKNERLSSFSGGSFIIPITKYNYNDIVLLVKVVVGNDLTNVESRVFDLADWEENYKTQYPYIYGAFGVPYIGKAGNRFNINNNVSIAYQDFGTVDTETNFLRCSKNVKYKPIPNYNNNDVYDYNGEDIINYSSIALVNPRLNDYGFSFGIGNASITPNATLDTFAATGNSYGNSGIYMFSGDETIIDSYAMGTPSNVSRVVTVLKSDIDIRKLISWYGIQFVDHINKIQAEIGSDDLCIPVINFDGYTTDEYKRGEESLQLDNADWGEDFRERNGYSGEASEQFNMETELRPNNLSASSPFTYQYIIEPTQIQELKNFLYTTVTTDTDETELFQKFLTNNPIDTIVSLCVFPFNVENYCNWVAGEHVITGNVDTGIIAKGLYSGLVVVVDGGEIQYKDKYKDFRSYEPYCDAEIFIPYHGSIHIAPSEMLGHTLGIKYIVDICSGASIALLFRDGLAIDSISGQIGGALRLTGIQTASYHNSVYQANATLKQQKIGLATQTASFGVKALNAPLEAFKSKDVIGTISGLANSAAGLAQSAIEVNKTEYQLNHVQIPYKAIGTNTVFSSMGNEQYCRLILKRPLMLDKYDATIYGHTKGFACCITDKLSNYHGYTEIQSIDLSDIPCTNEEQKILESLLIAGVYL